MLTLHGDATKEGSEVEEGGVTSGLTFYKACVLIVVQMVVVVVRASAVAIIAVFPTAIRAAGASL